MHLIDACGRRLTFLVGTKKGGESIILGLPWLCRINPVIDWEKGRVTVCPTRVTVEEVED